MIYECFRATGAYEAVQGFADVFTVRLQNDDVQDFDVRRDSCTINRNRSAFRTRSWKDKKVKITGFCSTSD